MNTATNLLKVSGMWARWDELGQSGAPSPEHIAGLLAHIRAHHAADAELMAAAHDLEVEHSGLAVGERAGVQLGILELMVSCADLQVISTATSGGIRTVA
mgnify:CR=1 FL=1